MAGSNQAVNLGGMLSQIGGAVGSMGKTAGEALSNPIKNMTRPDVDTDDPVSMRNYANYLRQRGDEAGAVRYSQMADQLDAKTKTMNAMVEASEVNQKGMKGAEQGDTRYIQQQIAETQKKLVQAKNEGNTEGFAVHQQQIQQLQQMLPAAKKVSQDKQVAGALKYEEMIQSGQLPPETAKQLQRQKDMMLEDPKVRDGYTQAKIQQDQVRRMQQQQQDEQVIAGASNLIFQAETPEAVDEALQKIMEDPNASPTVRQEATRMANSRATILDKQTAREERATTLATPVVNESDIESMRSSIAALSKDNKLAPEYKKKLEGLIEADKKARAQGSYLGQFQRDNMMAEFNKLENRIAQANMTEEAAARQARYSQDNAEARIVQEAEEAATLGPSRTDITQRMQAEEDAGTVRSYEQTRELLQRELEQQLVRVRSKYAPEAQEAAEAEADALYESVGVVDSSQPELRTKQISVLKQLVARYPDRDPAELVEQAKKQKKWPVAGGKSEETKWSILDMFPDGSQIAPSYARKRL